MTPDLPTMLLLLRQHRLPTLLSCGLLLVALLVLGLATGLPGGARWLLAASVLAGLVALYFAMRLRLDAALLAQVLREGLDGVAAARRVDVMLHTAGLRRLQTDAPVRGWGPRWAGMQRLLRGHWLALAVQLLLSLAPLLWWPA